jgi:hypothetical protein
MSSGITHMNGHLAGAARLGAACPAYGPVAGTAASIAQPMHAEKWLVSTGQPTSPVFGTDRPNPRPPERSP